MLLSLYFLTHWVTLDLLGLWPAWAYFHITTMMCGNEWRKTIPTWQNSPEDWTHQQHGCLSSNLHITTPRSESIWYVLSHPLQKPDTRTVMAQKTVDNSHLHTDPLQNWTAFTNAIKYIRHVMSLVSVCWTFSIQIM